MKAANIHSFIVGLARDYGTRVGENAHLRSQMDKLNKRLKIARVLARPWAKDYDLDAENQAFVLDTVRWLTTLSGNGRTGNRR